MRQILVLLMLLIIATAIIRPSLPAVFPTSRRNSVVPDSGDSREHIRHGPVPADDWRRSSRGWEHFASWQTAPSATAARAIHPALVAVFWLLFSLAGLVAYPARR